MLVPHFLLWNMAICATRREIMSLWLGLKLFRQYIFGRLFLIRIDNMALTHYRTMRHPTGQATRFLEYLSAFTFDVEYRNTNAIKMQVVCLDCRRVNSLTLSLANNAIGG